MENQVNQVLDQRYVDRERLLALLVRLFGYNFGMQVGLSLPF